MRLFYKLYFFLILLLVLILAGAGYISYQREVTLFNHDMEKDTLLLGEALSGMIGHTWKHSGAEKARELIRDANSKEDTIDIRWVDLGASPADRDRPLAPREKIGQVLRGLPVSMVIKIKHRGSYRVTYVPVITDGPRPGALELAESLSPLQRYTRMSLLHLLATGGLIMLAAGGLLWFHFYKWVHRPLIMFTEKSRRIGRGDLTPDLIVTGRDEFAVLGQTLNSMCEELAASLEALRVENERRIEALEQLRHSERLATLGRLSAGMAHELGTPLNVIAGRAKQIRSGGLASVEITDFSRIIEEQTRRIIGIMQNLLDFARRRKPNRSLQDMSGIVKQVLDLLASVASKAKVDFNVIQQGEIPPVAVDPLQMQQVLTNLVMNAIQAMDKGGRLEVILSIEKSRPPGTAAAAGEYLAVHICDEGPGIPTENLNHLFEPFFTTKEVGSGTGLGLSIAYGIVQEHNGWIEVTNRPEKGACFIVFLPVEEPS